MKSASEEILGYVQVLVREPEAVTVTQIDGTPTIFEIKSCKDDHAYLITNVMAIRAIGVMFAGLEDNKFFLKFIVG